MLGPYELIERLGEGGMGAVYRGVHRVHHYDRAIKVMVPPAYSAGREMFVRLFEREARLAARLRHPHIVRIYDVAEQGETHYIVMELLAGRSLASTLRSGGPPPIPRTIHLLRQLADALDYAHGQGIVHRDLKPANAFVSPIDHLTLVDFGIARAADETHLPITAAGMGTIAYMAPEMFDESLTGEEHNTQVLGVSADLYGLGIVAYELFTGRVPFSGTSRQILSGHLNRQPPSPSSLRADLPTGFEAVLLRQLEKEPKARYPSAGLFVEGLDRAMREQAAVPSNARGRLPTEPMWTLPPVDVPVATVRPLAAQHSAPERQPSIPQEQTVRAPIPDVPLAVSPLTELDRLDVEVGPSAEGWGDRSRVSALLITVLVTVLVVVMTAVLYRNGTLGEMGLAPGPPPTTVPTAAARLAATATAPLLVAPPPSTAQVISAPATASAVVRTTTAPVPTVAATTPVMATAVPATPTPGPQQRLAQFQTAVSTGEYASAIDGLRVLRDDPTVKADQSLGGSVDELLRKAHIGYGNQLLDQIRLDESYAQFAEALKLATNDPEGLGGQKRVVLAKNYARMEAAWGKDDETAIGLLEENMALDAGYRETRQKLYALLIAKADRLLRDGDRDGAFTVLTRALQVLPDGGEAQQRLAGYTPTPTPVPTPHPVAPTSPPAPKPQTSAPPQTQPAPVATAAPQPTTGSQVQPAAPATRPPFRP